MQHRPTKDFPFASGLAANQVPLMGESGQYAELHCMSLFPCMHLCMCATSLAALPGACRLRACLSVCIYAQIASYGSLLLPPPPPMHPGCFCPRPCRMHHVVTGLCARVRGVLFLLCVPLACAGGRWPTGSLCVALLPHGRPLPQGAEAGTGGWSMDASSCLMGLPSRFWVDVAVARPVVLLRGQVVWIPRWCVLH